MVSKIITTAVLVATLASSGLSKALLPSKCPTYWTAFGDHCYSLIRVLKGPTLFSKMSRPFRLTEILFLTFVVVAESGSCPTYWTEFGSSCYRFFGQRVNIKAAQDNCRIHGSAGRFAYLVSIHSKEENDFLVALFQSYTESSSDPHSHVWIGFSHEEGEETFVWTDGTDTDFANWGAGRPTVESSAQGVVLIHPNHGDNGRWHETTAAGLYRYICKMPMFDQ